MPLSNSAVTTEEQEEKEMATENVPERFMDIISGEFAYNPIRLPPDQDSTQALYNRKTLEIIWETKPVARNPYTRQWFDMKNVIPQIELRQEMEQYIKLRKVPANCQAEIDVIADYTKHLEEGMMKQLLNELRTSVTSERWTDRKQYWETIWKKINLVRLYCQSHNANIQTFRSLRGYQYFDKIVAKANLYLSFRSCSKDHNEAGLMDICKELVRTVDIIGLISSDIAGENSMGFNIISGLISILGRVYFHSDGYMKMQTAVLRIYCKIFNKLGAHIVKVVGHEFYVNALKTDVLITAIDKLIVMKAPEIIGEDLNHGISILRRAWIKDKNVMHHINYARSLVDAVFLCRCREIEIPDEKDINEGEMVEARVQRSHNSAALEKGLTLMKEILIEGTPYADIIQDMEIVKDIVSMFKHLYMHPTNFPLFCEKGCNKSVLDKSVGCVHFRISQLGLEIVQIIEERGQIIDEISSNFSKMRVQD